MTDKPYSQEAQEAALTVWRQPRCATPGERHVLLALDAAHDPKLGPARSVNAAQHRQEVIDEVCQWLQRRCEWLDIATGALLVSDLQLDLAHHDHR